MEGYVADDFQRFRGWVARQKAVVDRTNLVWLYYQWGPKEADPIFLLHGATGTAECWHNQFLSLCPKGYNLVSVCIRLILPNSILVQHPTLYYLL